MRMDPSVIIFLSDSFIKNVRSSLNATHQLTFFPIRRTYQLNPNLIPLNPLADNAP